jgi:hypothetical protein
MYEWHDPSCKRLDLYEAGNIATCLNCGSSQSRETNHSSDEYSESEYLSGLDDDTHPLDEIIKSGSFVHEKIRQKEEIRLLRLKPGAYDDPVECTVNHENLRQILPQYDAISYTWADDSGNRSVDEVIRLNGQPFAVTNSCLLALRRVRQTDYTRIIWVDAVCINQDDNSERSHQVQLMAQIYARATCVLVYIGETSNASDTLLQNIERIGFEVPDRTLHRPLAELLCRPYFWRVWVLQEIALASSALLICGEISIPWASFSRATLRRRLWSAGGGWKPLGNRLQVPHDRTTAMNLLQNATVDTGRFSILPPSLALSGSKIRDINELLDILDLGSFCEASDPKDKVFALFGLVTGLEAYDLIPDYDAEIEDIFARLAYVVAKEFGIISLLSRVVCRRRLSASLPWVPDWRGPAHLFESAYTNKIQQSTPTKVAVDQVLDYSDEGPELSGSSLVGVEFPAARVCSLADIVDHAESLDITVFPADDCQRLELRLSQYRKSDQRDDIRLTLTQLVLFTVTSHNMGFKRKDAMDGCLILSYLPPSSPEEESLGINFCGLVMIDPPRWRNPFQKADFWTENIEAVMLTQFSQSFGWKGSVVPHLRALLVEKSLVEAERQAEMQLIREKNHKAKLQDIREQEVREVQEGKRKVEKKAERGPLRQLAEQRVEEFILAQLDRLLVNEQSLEVVEASWSSAKAKLLEWKAQRDLARQDAELQEDLLESAVESAEIDSLSVSA